jgi:hypothetical protein
VLLRLDLAARREPHPHELGAQRLTELRLREKQHVVRPAPPHEHRRDHARLRRQEQRVDGAVVGNVVREHPVQEVDGVRALHAHVRARPSRSGRRNGCHRSLD